MNSLQMETSSILVFSIQVILLFWLLAELRYEVFFSFGVALVITFNASFLSLRPPFFKKFHAICSSTKKIHFTDKRVIIDIFTPHQTHT